jgi:hypothetical protein
VRRAIADGSFEPRLEAGWEAIADPLVALLLERGPRRGRGWIGRRAAAFLHPLAEGRSRLATVPTPFVPHALARLNDLGPRPRIPGAPHIVLAPGALAEAVAARSAAAAQLPREHAHALDESRRGLREHWRVESRWRPASGSTGTRAIEVLDTEAGLWLVVPDDPTVELWPTTPTNVFRALCEIAPYDHDVAA